MLTTLEELYSIFLNHRIISTDSRQVKPGSLFFSLKGENFDGNKYARTAIEAGAAYAVIDNEAFTGNQTLLVENVLEALQQLALMHRCKYTIPVIAVTGSNGKTTTKELVNAVLSRQYSITCTTGNLNNHIGVPLTLLEITDKTEIAVVEMGANHQGEIAQLCRIAEPTHGLITNIGRAHLGGFGGFEGVIRAKSELYDWLRLSGGEAFVSADNPLLMKLSSGLKRTLYGSLEGIQTRGRDFENSSMLELEWISGHSAIIIKTNLVGHYNFENVMAAICTGTYFELPGQMISQAISDYVPSNSRSQAMKTDRNSIILDAYNANPSSMQLAIENFGRLEAQHKMLILGDMLELGDESYTEHQTIVSRVETLHFDLVIFVGPDFQQVASDKFTCFATSGEALAWLMKEQISGYTILVKGSRGIKMENVLDAL